MKIKIYRCSLFLSWSG